ncbi:MAG: MBL fold metallo-hydrolase [Acidobacteriia bacterium]|nr:MBL fold metallo-hydrolase [Terriglobia bacterium]
MNARTACLGLALLATAAFAARPGFEKDIVKTSAGDLEIGFIGHGSLMFAFQGKVIHVDPYGKEADYASLPKASLVLVTHDHRDHLDPAAIAAVRTAETAVVVSPVCEGKVEGALVLRNGESRTVAGIPITAVPAYNIVHVSPDGAPFHPKGEGNGYVLTFGDTRVYVAGDTENVPEMKDLKDIAIAFLPMNLPYTMTPEMAADAARAFKPRILYPYHCGDTDPGRLVALLATDKGIEVRVRKMK